MDSLCFLMKSQLFGEFPNLSNMNSDFPPIAKDSSPRETIPYICDFSRCEKSSSMKRPTLKVIDFDSVVQNTKSSKSIILMSAFSNILLQSRSSEATNIGYRISSRAVFG